jgi:hypothetical protein
VGDVPVPRPAGRQPVRDLVRIGDLVPGVGATKLNVAGSKSAPLA